MDDNDDDLPSDYEVCSICGYDHEYDWPLLPPAERERAVHEHELSGA